MMNRRRFLRTVAAASTGVLAGPVLRTGLSERAAFASPTSLPFVDSYQTNVLANQTPETNAAVRILTGMQRVWKTGSTWNGGIPLMPELLRANVSCCEQVTAARTEAQAKEAFIYDRQHQSYAMIGGLGPLADLYKAGAKAVTGITSAPDGTPATTISDAVPAGAPAGSALGAG